MRLTSPFPPPYLPEPGQTTVLRLGLQSLDPVEWMPADLDLPQMVQHKTSVGQAQGARVYQTLPGSVPAQEELRTTLLEHLVVNQGDCYRIDGNTLHCRIGDLRWDLQQTDLWHTSLWVAEDICLLEKINGAYRLTAASLCSPSNWKLEEKMGETLDMIHGPVPGYEDVLASRVNRLFDQLQPHKPLLRYNWSLQPDNELFWRADLPGTAADLDPTSPDKRFWRVERQTLRRLPNTGAIVFAIRISLHSVAAMDAYPEFRSAIGAILASLPEAQKRYKGLADLRSE